MTTSAQIRQKLVDALRLDLIGPEWDDKQRQDEVLDTAPSRFYLTGFLIPYDSDPKDRADETVADDMNDEGKQGEESDNDHVSTRRSYYPSSMGLTVLVPEDISQVHATVRWGDYEPSKSSDHKIMARKSSDDHSGKDIAQTPSHEVFGSWQRTPQEQDLVVNVADGERLDIPNSRGLQLVTAMRNIELRNDSKETANALSIYVVNRREPTKGPQKDSRYAFQVSLEVKSYKNFVPRPNPRGLFDHDPDEITAGIQYRDVVQYAVGHNVAADSVEGGFNKVRTEWMPAANVFRMEHQQPQDMQADMQYLGNADAAETQSCLSPLIKQFAEYLQTQTAQLSSLEIENQKQHGKTMVRQAEKAGQRMQAGLELLSDPVVLTAFQIANRVVARAHLQTRARAEVSPRDVAQWVADTQVRPTWRAFQIGFILMNLSGLVNKEHIDRETVDLLFFPTGGGKTEAYLGLAAFTLALRRLRDPSIQSGGLTVLMRYTLRLLTLDQMDRASALIFALELERLEGPNKDALGEQPFEIGLWVGQAATPNVLGEKNDRSKFSARKKLRDFKNDPNRYGSPVPLQVCPWCGDTFTPEHFKFLPDDHNPKDLRLFCKNRTCDFRTKKLEKYGLTGLPILFIDEVIYNRLPCFLIATADKFAGLPWLAATGKLFGKVERYHKGEYLAHEGGYKGEKLKGPLAPPDLIIQDELHLISGPLGTMVGLYETALEALMSDGFNYKPKIIASTATVRRAERQIQGLFARNKVAVFPPPGLDYSNNFFSAMNTDQEQARLYLGVGAQGRSLKVVLLRSYLALLAAAQKLWLAEGGDQNPNNPVDPYMTLLGYFNALRELGGSRRIVEDEIKSHLLHYEKRKRLNESEGSFANRPNLRMPVELTSREPTAVVARSKEKLNAKVADGLDVALATNMISVGLDISRLGLMVVLGQPKTAAEYIQATSRVGRQVDKPGLVVTLLNVHRPRDRSHFESFSFWHSCFYRAVEANSVTPFSARALDRALSAVVVSLARHLEAELTPPKGALAIEKHRKELTQRIIEIVTTRAKNQTVGDIGQKQLLTNFLENRITHLLETWEHMASETPLAYQKGETSAKAYLLHQAGRKDSNQLTAEEEKFQMQWSLREVEPKVNLFIEYPLGYGKVNK